MRFLTENDYSVQIRKEILHMLDDSQDKHAIRQAEDIAISQVKHHLSGRYDITELFNTEDRDAYLIMLVIDLALYHLWSKKAPKEIPEYRAQRYQDAKDWLEKVGEGSIPTDLPPIHTDINTGDIRLFSAYPPLNNKF